MRRTKMITHRSGTTQRVLYKLANGLYMVHVHVYDFETKRYEPLFAQQFKMFGEACNFVNYN